MIKLLLNIFCFFLALTFSAGQSVLSSGKWYKVSVTADGIYQIDNALLKKLGIDPSKVNPSTLKLYGYPNGMLPQANSVSRQKDLREIAILVAGESDGKFNSTDRIIFYGQGPDRHEYNSAKKTFWYEDNLYSDKNYYFLTYGGSSGKRLSAQESINGMFPIVNTFNDFVQFEEDTQNILHSGRDWFGFSFGSTTEATAEFKMSGIVNNSEITLISKVMARALEPASFNVFYNSVQVGTQNLSSIPNSTYGVKGRTKSDTMRFSTQLVNGTQEINRVKYQYVKSGTLSSVGFMDNFLVSAKRSLALYGNSTIATLGDIAQSHSAIEITTTDDLQVWDISDPFEVKNQTHTFSGGQISFNLETTSTKRLGIFKSETSLTQATAEGSIDNQNLQTVTNANLIIISHPTLISEAERLAEHRQSFNNISSVIATPDQIYNEYSGGRQDVSAIRDFIRDVYQKSGGNLKYTLLFGRGSYDYKDREVGNTNLVPIYESRNSLSPLETYSSDDFYGFLEDFEGEWSETNNFNHTLDIGIGRLPARTTEHARDFVNKLIEYDTHPKSKGQWRSEIVFVADDGDGNLHQRDANQIANYVENTNPGIHAKKVYLDLYNQIQKSFGQVSPEGTDHLYRALHEGAMIINFTGHGSESIWMQERMLDPVFVATTKNRYKYPLLITATCEFGRCDDPGTISSAENLLVRKSAGVIGLVTTSRPVNSATNYELNYDFYDALLSENASRGEAIGTVFRVAKNKGGLGIPNRNFSLLGDPSMIVGPSQNEIVITEFKNSNNENQIIGLSNHILSGEIRSAGLLRSDFNGEVDIRIFQKAQNRTTKGDENSPFNFSEHSKLIFQGKADVKSGIFQLEFISPEITEATISTGRIVMYANSDNEVSEEAIGSSTVSISTVNNVVTDNQPPSISLFMNDTTFVNGGIASENPFLIALLQDNSAIDISGTPNRLITATLDDDSTFVLSTYYQTDANEIGKGRISFQLFDLTEGKHSITVTAFDILGNKNTSKLDFVVGGQNELIISKAFGWPNPFKDQVKIGFYHNRSGEDLHGVLTICNSFGQPVHQFEFEAPGSPFSTQILDWDGTNPDGSKLPSGLYILRLSVRSLQDGSKSEIFGKLILSN